MTNLLGDVTNNDSGNVITLNDLLNNVFKVSYEKLINVGNLAIEGNFKKLFDLLKA